jgi:ribosomal-protein-alanine N-acetyltransferase
MTPSLPAQHTSERLLLRRYSLEDAPAYFHMLEDNRAHLREFLPANLDAASTVDDIRAVIAWMIEQWQSGGLFIMGLWEKTGGDYVGEVHLANPIWDLPCIEVGYFIVKQQTARGYATEAARAACRMAFEQLGVRRV